MGIGLGRIDSTTYILAVISVAGIRCREARSGQEGGGRGQLERGRRGVNVGVEVRIVAGAGCWVRQDRLKKLHPCFSLCRWYPLPRRREEGGWVKGGGSEFELGFG